MSGPVPYLLFPGTAREALTRYQAIFGGSLFLGTRGEMGVSGPADEIQHGEVNGLVHIFGADAEPDEDALRPGGWMLSLLGSAPPDALHEWFDALAADGRVLDPLARKPWGATDGQVIDAFGVTWLIGYEDARDD